MKISASTAFIIIVIIEQSSMTRARSTSYFRMGCWIFRTLFHRTDNSSTSFRWTDCSPKSVLPRKFPPIAYFAENHIAGELFAECIFRLSDFLPRGFSPHNRRKIRVPPRWWFAQHKMLQYGQTVNFRSQARNEYAIQSGQLYRKFQYSQYVTWKMADSSRSVDWIW